jgi:hypothetical protein
MQPVLKALQQLPTLPFEKELTAWTADRRGDRLNTPIASRILALQTIASAIEAQPARLDSLLSLPFKFKSLHLDTAQMAAFLSALRSRVAVIQGPPVNAPRTLSVLPSADLHL